MQKSENDEKLLQNVHRCVRVLTTKNLVIEGNELCK